MQPSIFRILFLCFVGTAVSTVNAGLIKNAGFELGDIAGAGGSLSPIPFWGGNATFATDDSDFVHGGFGSHSGLAYAAFAASGAMDSISQVITTTPGQAYELSFWFASDGLAPNHFQVLWDSAVLLDEQDIQLHDYQIYVFSVLGTGSNTLTFSGQNDLGYLSLDDVSLSESIAAVPEPSSIASFGIGVLGSSLLAHRNKKRKLS